MELSHPHRMHLCLVGNLGGEDEEESLEEEEDLSKQFKQ